MISWPHEERSGLSLRGAPSTGSGLRTGSGNNAIFAKRRLLRSARNDNTTLRQFLGKKKVIRSETVAVVQPQGILVFGQHFQFERGCPLGTSKFFCLL